MKRRLEYVKLNRAKQFASVFFHDLMPPQYKLQIIYNKKYFGYFSKGPLPISLPSLDGLTLKT